jgi:hypothetical protein
MTDLAIIKRIYEGSDGETTKMLYQDLEKLGPMGVIAMNLFRACKCSERAKSYRPGRGQYRAKAYARKDWSIRNLAHELWRPFDHDLTWGWAIDEDLRKRGDPHHHLIYIDLPTGQVSFHTSERSEGPDYAGQWDGVRDAAADRVIRFVVRVFQMEAV